MNFWPLAKSIYFAGKSIVRHFRESSLVSFGKCPFFPPFRACRNVMNFIFPSIDSCPRLRLRGAWMLLALSFALAGCGGQKYTKDFKEWLGLQLASTQPMKLERVTIEEVSGGKVESVFNFRGEFSVTEDLYEEAELPDDLSFGLTVARFSEVGQFDKGIAALHAIEELNVKILRVVTPKGSKGVFSGKARAEMNHDGSWAFAVLEGDGSVLKGKRPQQATKWVIEGSKEAKELLAILKTKIAALEDLADKTEKEAADAKRKTGEERQRLAEETKKREEAFLAVIAPGKEIIGVWQGGEASGEIGVRFGEQLQMTDGYSIQGQIFDPVEPSRAKAFSGTITGDGTPDKPYVLNVRIPKSEGKRPDDAEMARTRNKTAGFLLAPSQFGMELRYHPEEASFSGYVQRGNYIYDPNVAPGPDRGKVPLQFPNGYTPKPTHTDAATSPDTASAGGVQFRMSVEEMDRQLVLSAGLYHDVTEAMRQRNLDGFHKAVAEIKNRYPDSPNALLAEMILAGTKGDKPKIHKLHATLLSEYPLDDGLKEIVNALYEKTLTARE